MHKSDPGIFFDQFGLIVQRDGDGGDTAQREGWVWFGNWIVENLVGLPAAPLPIPIDYPDSIDLLEVRPGEFCRHPTQGGFKSNPDDFSRDQAIPLIAAMGIYEDYTRLTRLESAIRTCFGFLKCVQGTQDVVDPPLANLLHRAQNRAPDRAADLILLGGVVNRLKQANINPDDVGDDLNLIIYLLMAKLRQPTDASDRAAELYVKSRPQSSGCFISQYRKTFVDDFDADEPTMQARIASGVSQGWQPDCSPIQGALNWYFRAESGGCSKLGFLYGPLLSDLLS